MLPWKAAVTQVVALLTKYSPQAIAALKLVAPLLPDGPQLITEAEAIIAEGETLKAEFSALHATIDPATLPSAVPANPVAPPAL